jgi:hypothetical protein
MTASQSDRRSTAFVAASVPENYQQRLAPVLFEPWATLLVETVGYAPGTGCSTSPAAPASSLGWLLATPVVRVASGY